MEKGTIKLFILMAFLLFSTTILHSNPANPDPIIITQPDGKTLTVFVRGDERINWFETMDGFTLLLNKAGYLSYAQLDENGNLQPTDYIATDVDKRDIVILSFLNKIEKNLFYSDLQVEFKLKIWEIEDEAQNSPKGTQEVMGEYKTLCAFVEFPNKKMTKSKEEFDGLFNEEGYALNGAVGSVRDYFKEISYGQFGITITLCGIYEAPLPDTDYKDDARPLARWLAQKVASEQNIDFRDYDNNGNGKVDGFHFIYAGLAQNNVTIWPHKWQFDPPVTQNGKSISIYSCSNELRSGTNITTIAVICHEMGHAVLGAADYYDTDYAVGGQFDGTGRWDLMAEGTNAGTGSCPPHPNMKIKIDCGWVTPVVLNSMMTIKDMPNSAENPVAYRINTSTYNEYYLLENRQKVKFDSSIPGEGLLIYHVHSNQIANCINCKHPQRFYPVSARRPGQMPNSEPKSYRPINSTYCTFPQHYKEVSSGDSIHKVIFSDYSLPAMKAWNNNNTGKPISNIKNENGLISFDFMDPVVIGIDDVWTNDNSTIQITPNPANEQIEIRITNYALNQVHGQISNIDFYNVFGQMVKSVPCQGESNGEIMTQRISITDLSQGIYFIKAGTLTTKLVVQ